MALEQFHILYNSDGSYAIIENNGDAVYGFSYRHKNLSYDEVVQCIKSLRKDQSSTQKKPLYENEESSNPEAENIEETADF